MAYRELCLFDYFPFGKYKDELVGSVIEDDPNYVHWAINNTSLRLDDEALAYLESQ